MNIPTNGKALLYVQDQLLQLQEFKDFDETEQLQIRQLIVYAIDLYIEYIFNEINSGTPSIKDN